MNFENYTIQRFKVGIDVFQRIFSASENKDGTIRIQNVLSGKLLFNKILKSEILVNGNPMSNIQQLNEIIYNFSCVCDGETDDSEHKIFDQSFDNTFE